MKDKKEMFDQSDSLFWSRIRHAAGTILIKTQDKAEVSAGENIAKLYRVGNTIRIDLRYAEVKAGE